MATCRKSVSTQEHWIARHCEKWLKGNGALVRCGKEGAVGNGWCPIEIVLHNGEDKRFGDLGYAATQANWHAAVIWAAEKLGIPVPWAPCDCAECEGEWTEPVEEMGSEKCRKVAEQIGGGIAVRYMLGAWHGAERFAEGEVRHTLGHSTASEALRNALELLAARTGRYRDYRIWLGKGAMPQRAQDEEAEIPRHTHQCPSCGVRRHYAAKRFCTGECDCARRWCTLCGAAKRHWELDRLNT